MCLSNVKLDSLTIKCTLQFSVGVVSRLIWSGINSILAYFHRY